MNWLPPARSGVVEASQPGNRLLNEQIWVPRAGVRADSAARIGELTGAGYIVLGTVTSYTRTRASTGWRPSASAVSALAAGAPNRTWLSTCVSSNVNNGEIE